MFYDLGKHPYFTPWRDPASGVTSYVLTKKISPIQQTFYYTNSCLSKDEKWLWFQAAFPPSPQKALGVACLDPENPSIEYFPETGYMGNSPMVAEEGDAAYYCQGGSVWYFKRGGKPRAVCTLDPEYVNHRQIYRLATHLSQSPDKRYFLLDGDIGNHWFIALADLETGKVNILKEFARNYNHAQFSPVHPGLFSMAEDWWYDRVTGRHFPFDHRIWLMNTSGGVYEPMKPGDWFGHGTDACHEWWSKDGLVCWVDYKKGVFEHDVGSGVTKHVWKGSLCHAHCDSGRTLWCADQSPYAWDEIPCRVSFYNRDTGKETDIASGLPAPIYGRQPYHLDPHPQFSPGDTWVVYTTTAMGGVDVALAEVAKLS